VKKELIGGFSTTFDDKLDAIQDNSWIYSLKGVEPSKSQILSFRHGYLR
jgi:hypothetical protein